MARYPAIIKLPAYATESDMHDVRKALLALHRHPVTSLVVAHDVQVQRLPRPFVPRPFGFVSLHAHRAH